MRNIRVLEIAGGLAGAYCGRLFAGAGATVVLAEDGDGGPIRRDRNPDAAVPDALHQYLNAGKRSVVMGVDDDRFSAAAQWADIVISTSDGEPDKARELHTRIASANPRAVHVVLSGFGLDGPCAYWKGSPIVDWASGGYLYITGEADREPLQGGGPWAAYLTGATAAVGALAAVFIASETGQGELVDISAMEAIASGHQWTLTLYTHTGAVKGRWGTRFGEAYHPMSLYQCADGAWVCIGAPSREQWENFCITTGLVELLADDALFAPGVRFERANEIDEMLAPWLAEHDSVSAVEALQAARVTASLVLNYAQVVEAQQLKERDFWAEITIGDSVARMPRAAFRSPDTPGHLAAPELGDYTDDFAVEIDSPRALDKPSISLREIRVLEFSVAWAGPLAGRFLGDLGIDVIKVEHPTGRGLGMSGSVSSDDRGNDWQWGELAPPEVRAEVFPQADPGTEPWNRMGLWNKLNRNKRSLCLDAKLGDGPEILAKLVGSADLLVHNYSPRGAKSLGIDHPSLLRHNPSIASVAMTGYGETGPMASHSSYGPILEAFGGFDEATGYIGEGPMRIGLAFPDAVGGVHGAFACLTALWDRASGHGPVHIDLSQLETLLSIAGDGLLETSVSGEPPARPGNRSAYLAPQGVYRCRGTDSWVALSVATDEQWGALVELIEDKRLIESAEWTMRDRRDRHDLIDEIIESWTAGRSAFDVTEALQGIGVAATPAYTSRDLVEHPQLVARRFLVEFDLPSAGKQTFPGSPLHFSHTDIAMTRPPKLGEHNDEILQQLGFGDDQISAIQAAGTVANRPPQ